MATTIFTDGVTLSAASWANDVDTSAYAALTSVAGTANAITATGPANYTHASGRLIRFVPTNTNSAATAIVITPSGGAALASRNIFWNGVACVGDEIRANIPCVLFDDGTQLNIVGNGFPAPFLDTYAVVEGGTDRTKKIRFEVDGLTTATTRALTVLDADFTIGAATQAQQETGTILTASVTPGRQHFHPSACKAWGDIASTPAINTSYNITSVADAGTGLTTVTIATDFSGTSYAIVIGVIEGGDFIAQVNATPDAGSFVVRTYATGTGTASDRAFCFACFGDQA